jgi:uncharacterized membrane protein YqgA involved in biofilm formation
VKGTIVNTGAVLAGGVLGALLGSKVEERFKTTILHALGVAVIYIGLRMALSAKSELLAVGCLLLGAITGEALRIEDRVCAAGEWLKGQLRSSSPTFAEGFATASILYVTGAMAIIGAIKDGVYGDPSMLYVKALLDGSASIIFGSALGIGVAASALSVLLYQGAFTLLASRLTFLEDPAVLSAVNGVGGLLVLAIGINLLGVVKIRTGNLIPGLFYAIIFALYLG